MERLPNLRMKAWVQFPAGRKLGVRTHTWVANIQEAEAGGLKLKIILGNLHSQEATRSLVTCSGKHQCLAPSTHPSILPFPWLHRPFPFYSWEETQEGFVSVIFFGVRAPILVHTGRKHKTINIKQLRPHRTILAVGYAAFK